MTPVYRRLRAGLVAPSLILAGLACDGPPPVTSSTTQATVKGTVTVKGKPASSGTVVFDGANQGRPSATTRIEIGKDGSYEGKAFVGPNRVSLSGAAVLKLDPAIAYEKLNFEVQNGDNTLAIDLPTKK